MIRVTDYWTNYLDQGRTLDIVHGIWTSQKLLTKVHIIFFINYSL